MLYRPCLERTCPNLTSGSRCALHARRSTDSRPSSSQRGYDRDYQRKRVALLSNGARCVYCGKPATTVDHVRALALGGTNEMSNLAPCCARCNYSRGARLKNRGVRR
jgi:5-methylcytosine-specific restriction endonuclease McrA